VVVFSEQSRHGLVAHTVSDEPAPEGVVFLEFWWVTDRVVGWLLVENCTVDASILFFCG